MKFVSDWRECYEQSKGLLNSDTPVLLSRIGGSDTNALASYLQARDLGTLEMPETLASHRDMVQRYNGYYDRSQTLENYIRYLEELLSCYKSAENLFHCNFQLLSMYFPDNIGKPFYVSDIEGRQGFESLIREIDTAGVTKTNMPYTFVEKLTSHPYSLFNVFAEALIGKRVLVISPFSRSISTNFANRGGFFKNYSYPDFASLVLCDSPITYAGLPDRFYPHGNWFETTQYLKDSISRLDFDIALMACGSYAMPLGRHIVEVMKRKAVYVGGVLQLYFGVMGRRYADNAFFLDQINPDKFIFPLEGQRFLDHVAIQPETAHEAFGAYF